MIFFPQTIILKDHRIFTFPHSRQNELDFLLSITLKYILNDAALSKFGRSEFKDGSCFAFKIQSGKFKNHDLIDSSKKNAIQAGETNDFLEILKQQK